MISFLKFQGSVLVVMKLYCCNANVIPFQLKKKQKRRKSKKGKKRKLMESEHNAEEPRRKRKKRKHKASYNDSASSS